MPRQSSNCNRKTSSSLKAKGSPACIKKEVDLNTMWDDGELPDASLNSSISEGENLKNSVNGNKVMVLPYSPAIRTTTNMMARCPPARAKSRSFDAGSVEYKQMPEGTSTRSDNSDDEEDLKTQNDDSSEEYKQRRRAAHLRAEQKRRNAIKQGYDDLKEILPCPAHEQAGLQRASKAVILQRTIDYVQTLKKQTSQQSERVKKLENEAKGLRIMKEQLTQFVGSPNNVNSGSLNNEISDAARFAIFRGIMDELYSSFEPNVSVNDFATLSGSTFRWLEQYCTPLSINQAGQKVVNDMMRYNVNMM